LKALLPIALFLSAASGLLAQRTLERDLQTLAELDGPSGYEDAVAEFVAQRLESEAVRDNTGSLTVAFGAGEPRTLIAAGLDEPGLAVSGFHKEGYLRVESLAGPAPHYSFPSFFPARLVRVLTAGGKRIPGTFAAPSVHLRDDSWGSVRSFSEKKLFLDVGASSSEQAQSAGIQILDPVALHKQAFRLGEGDRWTAPWISSRAGAAVLLALARVFLAQPPEGTVVLGFTTQQHRYHRGLGRVLRRIKPQRVIFLRPGGGETPEAAPAEGWNSPLRDELSEAGDGLGIGIRSGSGSRLSFGPFGAKDVWPDPAQSVVLTLGVEHAGTPVEVVRAGRLEQIARLLAAFHRVEMTGGRRSGDAEEARTYGNGPAPAVEAVRTPRSLEDLIRELTALAGVSGDEGRIRERIRRLLPAAAQKRAKVDGRGNLIVRLGRPEPPAALFIAHMDEIGFRVSRIEAAGVLAVEGVGGILPDLFAWHPALLHTNSGAIRGIMMRDGRADAGAQSADGAAAMGIQAGTTLTPLRPYRRLLGRRALARAFDDRVGCAVLLHALRKLFGAAEAPSWLAEGRPVWVVFGVEEETGLHGAAELAGRVSPRRVYPVDSFVTSDTPLEDRRRADAPLGEGFVIRAMDTSGITPRGAVARAASLARRLRLPVQLGMTSGGNDGSKFTPAGGVNTPLSWPLRYAHSPAEVVDFRDIEALAAMVEELVRRETASRFPAAP